MFRFLHAADIHLDSPLRGLERYEDAPVEEVRSATRRAFENMIELAIEEEVAFVLLVGDLYDGDWRDYNTGLFFVGQMNRLREAGIGVHLVSGNHDAASQITRSLRLPENVTHYAHKKPQTVVLDELGVAIHGQSFATRSVGENLGQAYPLGDPSRFDIGLLHTSLDGRPPHDDYAPCTVDTLRSRGYQYWALGHVHRREEVSRDPWIVFPGNLQGRHIREAGAKGCTLVTVEDGDVREVESRAVDVVRWSSVRVDLSEVSSADASIDAVRQALDEAQLAADDRLLAARLILEGRSPAHAALTREPERWMQEYRAQASSLPGAGVWLEKVKLETKRPLDLDAELERDDALGNLLQMISRLESAPLELESLSEIFTDLSAKLPPELREGNEPLDPSRLATLEDALPEVKELLLSRLIEETGPR